MLRLPHATEGEKLRQVQSKKGNIKGLGSPFRKRCRVLRVARVQWGGVCALCKRSLVWPHAAKVRNVIQCYLSIAHQET